MNKYLQFCLRTLNRIVNLFDFTFQAILVRTIPSSPPDTMMGARRLEKIVNVLFAVISPVLLVVSLIYAIVALIVTAVAAMVGGLSRLFTRDMQPPAQPVINSYAAIHKSLAETNKQPLASIVAFSVTGPPSPLVNKKAVPFDEDILSDSEDIYDSLNSTTSDDDVSYSENCFVQ